MYFLPPQYIEFGRLAKLKKLSDLKEYAQTRVKCGTNRFCPNPRFCSDGIVMILPGDEEYQTNFDLENAPDISHLTCREAIDFRLVVNFKNFTFSEKSEVFKGFSVSTVITLITVNQHRKLFGNQVQAVGFIQTISKGVSNFTFDSRLIFSLIFFRFLVTKFRINF